MWYKKFGLFQYVAHLLNLPIWFWFLYDLPIEICELENYWKWLFDQPVSHSARSSSWGNTDVVVSISRIIKMRCWTIKKKICKCPRTRFVFAQIWRIWRIVLRCHWRWWRCWMRACDVCHDVCRDVWRNCRRCWWRWWQGGIEWGIVSKNKCWKNWEKINFLFLFQKFVKKKIWILSQPDKIS